MPYLQLDVPGRYSSRVKQRLAEQLGELFACVMQTKVHKVVVAFRELNEGSLWRCDDVAPKKAAVITCDIRSGRPAEQRARLAEAMIQACAPALNISPDSLSVQFTQHAGDEVYRPDVGLGEDWTPAEARADR